MKTLKQFMAESKQQPRVFRIDARPPEEAWGRNDYAIINDGKGNRGTTNLSQGHNVKPGDKYKGLDVEDVQKLAFATPHRPNAFYAAVGRTAGANGEPVRGAAVYDEDKMFGKKRDPQYKGEIHMTQNDYDAIPKTVRVHSASGAGWNTESYSGKDEVTSQKPATDTKYEDVDARKLIHDQYNVVIHPSIQSIKNHLEQVAKTQPHLSVLNQT